uniref:G-protein coupled receptors family 1 profile domain-containing protein n=1 Tax=Plectus sambesii TaxID=2011161 RepID=A0A914WJA2_9BILA
MRLPSVTSLPLRALAGTLLLLIARKLLIGLTALHSVRQCADVISIESLTADPQLAAVVDHFRSIDQPPAVLFFNKFALNMTANWLCNTLDMPGVHARALLVTLDAESRDFIRKFWPNLLQFHRPIDCLKDQFSFGQGAYHVFFILRANLAASLLRLGSPGVWMIQQDTVWRRSIFDVADLQSDTNNSEPFDVIFDRLAHVNAATLRSNWINGANYFARATNSSIRFFTETSRTLRNWYGPDVGTMLRKCHDKVAKCEFLPHRLVSCWEWLYASTSESGTDDKEAPWLLQMDGDNNPGGKWAQMDKLGFYFLDRRDATKCNVSAVAGAIQRLNDGFVAPSEIRSIGRMHFTFYWTLTDYLLAVPKIGAVISPYLPIGSDLLDFASVFVGRRLSPLHPNYDHFDRCVHRRASLVASPSLLFLSSHLFHHTAAGHFRFPIALPSPVIRRSGSTSSTMEWTMPESSPPPLNWTNTSHCYEDISKMSSVRFVLVTCFGSLISLVGCCNNVLLLYLFTRRMNYKTNHLFYLVFLAFFDICVEICYVLVFSVSIVYDFFHSYAIYIAWHTYVRSVATIAQISITAATYMIVVASVERYFTTAHWTMKNFTIKKRCTSVLTVVSFSIISKGTVYWELAVRHYPECDGFQSVHLEQSPLTRNRAYANLWMFWFRNIFHVFVPFFLLLLLNGAIIHRMRHAPDMQGALMSVAFGKRRAKQRKSTRRAATRMLGAIVATYLVTNVVNLIITAWEHVNIDSLRTLHHGRLYTYAADLSSILTITCGAIRLPIYYACNKDMRNEIKKLLATLLDCHGPTDEREPDIEKDTTDKDTTDKDTVPLTGKMPPPSITNNNALRVNEQNNNNNSNNTNERLLPAMRRPEREVLL